MRLRTSNPLGRITMYDSIEVFQIPPNARAVAGYVGGRWPTFPQLEREFPKAHKLSIAIAASEDADALDIEAGDATIAEAAAWVRRQHARGKRRPCVYINLARAQGLVNTLTAAGIVRRHSWSRKPSYRLWTAHYRPDRKRHRCGPGCGFGLKVRANATQYDDKALERTLDVSVCGFRFFRNT